MELIEYIDDFENNGYAHEDDLYLDIETTGVRRYADFAWCIGYSFIKNDKIISRQIFLENSKDELASLSLIQQEFDRFKRIITFNGDVFDLPFLYNRAQNYNMPLNFPQERIDLYKLLRANKKFMMLDKINLKTAESLSGVFRDDDMTGYETIKLYEEVLISNNPDKKTLLLNHNYYDVKNLPILMKIFLPIKNARTIEIGEQSFFVSDFYVTNDILEVKVSSKNEVLKIKYYDDFVSAESFDNNIIIKYQSKVATKDGQILRYFTNNNRVFEMDKLFYPIIKEEVENTLKNLI